MHFSSFGSNSKIKHGDAPLGTLSLGALGFLGDVVTFFHPWPPGAFLVTEDVSAAGVYRQHAVTAHWVRTAGKDTALMLPSPGTAIKVQEIAGIWG